MRIGFNPQKNKFLEKSNFFHQVLVPVYIPNQEGYFEESFEVLKLCLESLFNTIHEYTFITIINNGSCKEVSDYLDFLFHEKKIHEIIHVNNIGRVNAMLKGITGHSFSFFTNADADVLFKERWQEETYKIFENFPKAGVVSTTPNPKLIKYLTSNIFIDTIFSSMVKFDKLKNPEELGMFVKSIGNEDAFGKNHFEKILTIEKNGCKAVVGAGHFVATYKSSIFNELEKRFTEYIFGGDSNNIFDLPGIEKGYWRLTTLDNYTFHMGNTVQDWMKSFVSSQVKKESMINYSKFKSNSVVKRNFFIRKLYCLGGKVLFKKMVWRLFLQYRGLTRREAENY